MCIILHKKAKCLIDEWRLESAVIVNPDGWGYTIPEGNGKLYTRRQYNEKGNNAETILKTIEKHKHEEMFIHLRFKTQGELSILNCHPFTVTTYKKHGVDVQLLHNGTITDFNDRKDSRSDTKQFVDTIVTPLMERLLAYSLPESVMFDPLLAEIMDKYAGYNNRFILIDGFGNRLIINEQQGKKFDWGWASNEYSFNRTHREPVKYDPPAVSYGGQNNYKNFPPRPPWKNTKTTQVHGHTEPPKLPQVIPYQNNLEHDQALTKLNDRSIIILSSKEHTMPEENPRLTFCQMFDLKELSEISCFNETDISDLVNKEPDFACLLIQDLRDTLFNKTQTEKAAKKANKREIITIPSVPLITNVNEKAMPRIN
jgi:hypothetical protein